MPFGSCGASGCVARKRCNSKSFNRVAISGRFEAMSMNSPGSDCKSYRRIYRPGVGLSVLYPSVRSRLPEQ